ncbi:MAG: redoxin domain-containing protein [Deltaproteobacteria bacterium]|nr:redoxin domain-containing protein [Deltaproteobacteria bacterium]
MSNTYLKSLVIDDDIPSVPGRTDEGTPISLTDFKGRALAVFFLGKGFERTELTLVKNIKRRIDEFLEFECSPIVVSMEPEEILSSAREAEDLPFLLISDYHGAIHEAVNGLPTESAIGSWIVNDESKIVAAVPSMPPREQVSATVAALSRIVARPGSNAHA